MSIELGIWRVTDGAPVQLHSTGVPLEKQLEDFIEADPTLLGDPLMLIGRQVPTSHGGFIDLLGIDADARLHVLELKRDRTPREVVAQLLDYGSWAANLGIEDVRSIYSGYAAGASFDEAFAEFAGDTPPDELDGSHDLTIVAGAVDRATERIAQYLASWYSLPINVAVFRYFADGDHSYLARTFLVDEDAPSAKTAPVKKAKPAWNGSDWYVSFGAYTGGRVWEDARKYGFVSAGGGQWYSKSLRSLPVDARIFVCVPKMGYVGMGRVIGEAQRFDEATVEFEGQLHRLAELQLEGIYTHGVGGEREDDEHAEWVVPVQWDTALPVSGAIWKRGMFANQNSACKLRNAFTLRELYMAFGVKEEAVDLGD